MRMNSSLSARSGIRAPYRAYVADVMSIPKQLVLSRRAIFLPAQILSLIGTVSAKTEHSYVLFWSHYHTLPE